MVVDGWAFPLPVASVTLSLGLAFVLWSAGRGWPNSYSAHCRAVDAFFMRWA
jgi:hypothetical protein